MSTYIIDRSKWVCGGSNYHVLMGKTSLLNNSGRMCCLGQICEQSGVITGGLISVTSPRYVYSDGVPSWLLTAGNTENSPIARKMMTTNDTSTLTQKDRESGLKSLARKAGHTIKFIGRLFPKKS